MSGNRRMLLLLPLLLGAGWLALFGDKTPPGENAAVVMPTASSRPAETEASSPSAANAQVPPAEEETPAGEVRRMRDRASLARYRDTPGVDLFRDQTTPPAAVQSAPPEDAPQQPFTLIGRMYEQGHWLAFLDRDGATYSVRAGDVVDGFKIGAVTAQRVVLTKLADQSKHIIQIDDEKKEPAHE